jgi:pyruvate dehydrogenase E1 component
VTKQLQSQSGPFIAATDYMKSYTDQIREFVPGHFTVLGTDGFGRSDTRGKLRDFFEVSREFVVLAALKALADLGQIEPAVVAAAMKDLGISPDKVDPLTV